MGIYCPIINIMLSTHPTGVAFTRPAIPCTRSHYEILCQVCGMVDLNLDKIHPSAKQTSVGFLLITPYWYMDIYLFKNPFFQTSPIYIPIVISFCLTISTIFSWMAVFTIISFISKSSDEIFEEEFRFTMSIILSILFLSIGSLLSYVYYNSFKAILIINFMFPILISFVLILLSLYISKRNNKKKAKATNNNSANKKS